MDIVAPPHQPVSLPPWPRGVVVTDFMNADSIGFYGSTPMWLNNFSAHAISMLVRNQAVQFATVEAAYHYFKFAEHAPEVAELIRQGLSPMHAKQIAREHKTKFDPAWWDRVKIPVMAALNATKLAQHPQVLEALIATENRLIFENSLPDAYWGIGEDGAGRNVLGRIWMGLRAAVQAGRTVEALATILTAEAGTHLPALAITALQPMPVAELERGTGTL